MRQNEAEGPAAWEQPASAVPGRRHPWQALGRALREGKRKRQEKMRRRAQEREEAGRLAAREQAVREVETQLEELAREIAELAGDTDRCFCVYEDSVRKALVGERSARETERPLPALWKKRFPMEEFQGYTRLFWAKQLFPLAESPHFVILGTAPCLPELIEAYAHRMKSLRWIMTEGEESEEIIAFVEDFYTEYGLAIELQIVEDISALKRLRLFGREPVSVVDFTGETYVAAPAVPDGSVWLDMLSVEEKRRRLLAREREITYFSMKEVWKKAQKRCNCPVLP